MDEYERRKRDDMIDGIPYVAIGNDELGEQLGAEVDCPSCGQPHRVDRYGSETMGLQTVKCTDGGAYLVGLNGRVVTR